MVTTSERNSSIPPSFGDGWKRTFLGKPLTSEQLESERLANPVALGALSPDAISSTAYGPEQVMIELLPRAGMAAFVLLLPIIGVVLFILLLVSASYRGVVTTYTRAGGAYMVARDNFGPRMAQIAAAALLIDYVVTAAVQPAAGTVALCSAIPALHPYHLEITIGVLLLICVANLRGLRQSGRIFAITTYSFVAMITLTILTGLVREIFWGLPKYDPAHIVGAVPVHQGNGLVMGATVLVVLRAFANGGTSLTGVEAISNTVNVFREPQGVNARRVLTLMACILGFLLAGVAWLAFVTHATPYLDEYPSMLSEIARAVFGKGLTREHLVLFGSGVQRRNPFHRCQHRVQRLPRAGEFCCRGPLFAAAADQTRSPAGVLQRHHHVDGARGGAAAGDPRFGQCFGAVLRDRCVHRVRDGRLRYDQTPSHPP